MGDIGDVRRGWRVAAILRRQARVEHLVDVEFKLQPDGHLQPVTGQFFELAAQDLPRGERAWLAIMEIGVGENPAGGLHPGQHAESGRGRHQHAVRQADHFRNAEGVLGPERRHDRMVGGVENRRDELEILAGPKRGDEFTRGYRFAADYAMLVTPADTDIAYLLRLDTRHKLLRLAALFGTPEPVFLDEPDHTSPPKTRMEIS